jgi:hypothetical protein
MSLLTAEFESRIFWGSSRSPQRADFPPVSEIGSVSCVKKVRQMPGQPARLRSSVGRVTTVFNGYRFDGGRSVWSW